MQSTMNGAKKIAISIETKSGLTASAVSFDVDFVASCAVQVGGKSGCQVTAQTFMVKGERLLRKKTLSA
eukprot:IDg7006t1